MCVCGGGGGGGSSDPLRIRHCTPYILNDMVYSKNIYSFGIFINLRESKLSLKDIICLNYYFVVLNNVLKIRRKLHCLFRICTVCNSTGL